MIVLLTRLREFARSPAVAVVVLIAVNVIPLVGVIYLGWDAQTLLVLYWLESGVVGLINIPKIAMAEGPVIATASAPWMRTVAPRSPRWEPGTSPAMAAARAVIIVFFLLHYGFFWVGHGLFILLFLPLFTGLGRAFSGGAFPAPPAIDSQFLLLAALALLASHAISFWVNFIKRGEYRNVSPVAQAFQPYGRVFVLHFVIVLGGALVFAVGQPIALLALLVLFKTIIDVALHQRAHRRAQAPQTAAR